MIVEAISQVIINFIDKIGYLGLFILMTLESTIAPIPSEIVMPFSGFLISEQRFTLLGVAFISTLGTVTGSSLSYWMGKQGGNNLVKKFGKYIFLHEQDLLWTEQWFNKHGEKTIFISRFIPVVRHFISIPAGIARMNKFHFLLYTFLGGFIWNTFLACMGIILKNNWELVHEYSQPLDIIFVIILALALIYYIYKHLKGKHERVA